MINGVILTFDTIATGAITFQTSDMSDPKMS